MNRPPDAPGGPPPCLACRASSWAPFTRQSTPYAVLVCRRCGLGRTVPHPSPAALRALYEEDYATVDGRKFRPPLEALRRMFARAFAARVARKVGSGARVLDIGCGDGKLLVALAARGMVPTGTEVHGHAAALLRHAAGIDVHVGDLAAARFPAATFRAVILRHVLEHLPDPPSTLDEVHRIIEPDGLLVIAVPNLASWQARMARDYWFHLDLPRHLHHFTPTALVTLLTSTGFEVERVSHVSFEQNPYGWVQSALHAAGGRWRTLYDQLHSRRPAQTRSYDAIALITALALLPLSVMLALVEAWARHGGTIEVWARPSRAPRRSTPVDNDRP